MLWIAYQRDSTYFCSFARAIIVSSTYETDGRALFARSGGTGTISRKVWTDYISVPSVQDEKVHWLRRILMKNLLQCLSKHSPDMPPSVHTCRLLACSFGFAAANPTGIHTYGKHLCLQKKQSFGLSLKTLFDKV